MDLDPRTIAVVIVTSTLLIGGGLLAVAYGYLGQVPGTYRWALATLLQSVGWFVTGALRGAIPESIAASIGPFLIQLAMALCLFVLYEFEGRPLNKRWFYALLGANLVASWYFSAIHPSTVVRQVLVTLTAGPIVFSSAYVLATGPDRRVSSHRFMAGVFAVCGAVILARGCVFLIADAALVSPTQSNLMSSVTLMTFYIVAVVMPFGFVLMCNDRFASERWKAEEALNDAALTDALTRMPNRTMVTSRLNELASRPAEGSASRYAVLFIDLNNFKYVNDSLGHDAGDRLLIETGLRLTRVACNRDRDRRAHGISTSIAGRFGGDEFVLILEDIEQPADAAAVAERILEAMAVPFLIDEQRVSVQCSIGISVNHPSQTTSPDLLREADTAMYRAKLSGRANFVIFDESMHVQARKRLTLENDLRAALEGDEIHAYYQPIVDLTNGTVVGFEALARWHHPTNGLIPPDAFIPVAEETGLIVQIGQRMVAQAVSALERMNTLPGGESIRMNVNVSRRELVHPEFLTSVRDVVTRMQVSPARLRFEITETAVSGTASIPVSELLRELKELGVDILLDDFGAGLSSLSLLRTLPLDGIKIDRAFIERSTGDAQAITILNAIISLGRNLGKAITVEGVAEPAQVATILALGGDLAQGYLFGRPVPLADAESLLGADFSGSCAAA